MRVLVSGSRHFWKHSVVFAKLDEVCGPGPHVVIHGSAPGVDQCAHGWAIQREYDYQGYPAKWKTHGNAAGPIRNQQMLDEGKPDIVVAFPRYDSVGTRDMIRRAENINLPVVIEEI